jgi:hypothetical protein
MRSRVEGQRFKVRGRDGGRGERYHEGVKSLQREVESQIGSLIQYSNYRAYMQEKSLISSEELLEDISGEQERQSYYQVEVMCRSHER